jgi:hypothetical protein
VHAADDHGILAGHWLHMLVEDQHPAGEQHATTLKGEAPGQP